jgi:hypothetical protein
MTSIYEKYLDNWNNKVDNQEKKDELNETIIQSYESINLIKECIKKMNQQNDSQYANDAANIYHTNLYPLLTKIRELKYRENEVYNNKNTCHLIQKKYIIDDILLPPNEDDKIVAYEVGFKEKKTKKPANKQMIIKDETDDEKEEEEKFIINIKPPTKKLKQPKPPTKKLKQPKPPTKKPKQPEQPYIIGQGEDDITWNDEKFQQLWNRLPVKLKTEFKSNIEWMTDFMNKSVKNGKPYKLTLPPNIVIPPRTMDNGQYDFGVSIYNKVFNQQPESLQQTLLTLYKEDLTTKEKNYSSLEDALNKLVEKEVEFNGGFF